LHLKSCRVLQDHYDDECEKTVFHNTTPDPQDEDQDQDHSLQVWSWSQTGQVLRPTVSDHSIDSSSYFYPTTQQPL